MAIAKWFAVFTLLWALGLNLLGNGYLLTRPYPHNPFEGGITTDAWRSHSGLPVYESNVTGHATHMYGPLHTWLLGKVMLHPSNYTGRNLTFIVALFLMAALFWQFAPKRGTAMIISLALVTGISQHIAYYLVANRPDVIAFTLAGAALFLFYLARRRSQVWLTFVGAGVLVTAFLFKQTAAMAAAIPALALALEGKKAWFSPKSWTMALIPPLVVAVTLTTIKLYFPYVFFYAVTVPGHYPISALSFANLFFLFLCHVPAFLLMAFLGFRGGYFTEQTDRDGRLRWLLAAVIVTVPLSILTASKVGGTINSILPAILAVTALTFDLFRRMSPFDGRLTPTLTGMLLLLCFAQTFPLGPSFGRYFLLSDARKSDYPQIVERVRSLEGKVICPEDPTIPLLAKGTFSRSSHFELDVSFGNLPEEYFNDIRRADYVVKALDWWGDRLPASELTRLGFTRVEPVGVSYEIWRNLSRR